MKKLTAWIVRGVDRDFTTQESSSCETVVNSHVPRRAAAYCTHRPMPLFILQFIYNQLRLLSPKT